MTFISRRGPDQASPSGEPLYRAPGDEVTEHWQLWSPRRWVFGWS
jgi:hypothetical protein